jgi:hypothetical protein
MGNQILLLVLGFLLTTVGGGLLGYYFQNRTWKHQHAMTVAEAQRDAATKVFEEISRLMDKRLYRMRQVQWSLCNTAVPDGVLEHHMHAYRTVLYEWNDTLNRNLALTESYFGTELRQQLEERIYENFRRIGTRLETMYGDRTKQAATASTAGTDSELTALSNEIYTINLRMISRIQSGTLGSGRMASESSV